MEKTESQGKSRFQWLRAAFCLIIGTYLALALLFLAFRFLLLPNADSFRGEIESRLSAAAGAQVRIGHIAPDISSFWPRLRLENVSVRRPGDAAPALSVKTLEAQLDWSSVPLRKPVFLTLRLDSPRLSVLRTGESDLDIGGFRIDLSDPGENAFTDWLLQQGTVNVSNARVEYEDRTREGFPRLALDTAGITFSRSLGKWTAGMQGIASFGPESFPVDLRAEIGRTLLVRRSDWKTWSGKFYAAAAPRNVAEIAKLLYSGTSVAGGSGNAVIWADFSQGSVTNLVSDFRLSGLRYGKKANLSAAGRLFGSRPEEGNLMRAAVPSLRISTSLLGEPLTVSVDASRSTDGNHEDDQLSVRIPSLDLKATAGAMEQALGKRFPDEIRKLSPSGILSGIAFRLDGPAEDPSGWSFSSDFRNASLRAIPDKDPSIPGMPGGTNLSGHIDATPSGGRVTVSSRNGTAVFPGIFEHASVPFDTFSGVAYWQTSPRLLLSFRNMVLNNSQVSTRADAEWEDTGGSGSIRVAGLVSRAAMRTAYRYVPIVAGKGVIKWLEGALKAGSSNHAAVEWKGPIERFPYTGKDARSGHFLATGIFEGAVMDFLPPDPGKKSEWPFIEKGRGTFLFEGDRMVIAADSGSTAGVPLGPTLAEIPAMGGDGPESHLYIHGSASGPAQPMLGYLPKSPVSGWLDHFLDPVRASGSADFSLSLEIPLDHPENTLVSGGISFNGSDVSLGNGIPEFENSTGTVRFTQSDYSSPGIDATVWGFRAHGKMESDPFGGTLVEAETRAGTADARRFAEGNPLLLSLLEKTEGTTPADVTVRVGPEGSVEVGVRSSLEGIAVRLPRPFRKEANESRPLEFLWNEMPDGRVSINSRIDSLGEVRGALRKSQGTYSLEKLAAGIGMAPKLPKKGLSVRASVDHVNLNHWSNLLPSETGSTAGQKSLSPSFPIEEILVRTKRLTVSHRTFPAFEAVLREEAPWWAVKLKSENGEGTARYRPASGSRPAELEANLARLYIPEESRRRFRRYIETAPLESLPTMRVKIGNLQVEDINLGKVSVDAVSSPGAKNGHVWDIRSISADNGAAVLKASGLWSRPKGQNRTEVKGTLSIRDSEKLLQSLGVKQKVVRDAAGKVSLEASWAGTPRDFALQKLDGSLRVDIGPGQFLQVDPGIAGRFLSLISMQSLLKRLTLDFKDVFGEGFAFESITGTATVKSGVLATDDFRVKGTAASVESEATISLPLQTISGTVRILPNIHAEASAIALAAVNPFAGIGGLVAAYGLKQPLSQLLSTEYRLSGPLSKVTLTKESSPKPLDGDTRDGGS